MTSYSHEAGNSDLTQVYDTVHGEDCCSPRFVSAHAEILRAWKTNDPHGYRLST